MPSIEALATMQLQILTYACQHKDLQRDPVALTQWAMKEWELASSDLRMIEAAAGRAIMLLQEYQYYCLHAPYTPPKYMPAIARLLVAPFTEKRHFLHDEEHAHLCLHQRALVGSLPGPGNRALLYEYQQPVFCHEDQECIHMVGETFRGRPLTPFQFTGNEGYAPCGGCGLPVAGPSLKESFAHPPLPVPFDIAEIFYGSGTGNPFQPSPRQQQRRKQKPKGQLSLFDE